MRNLSVEACTLLFVLPLVFGPAWAADFVVDDATQAQIVSPGEKLKVLWRDGEFTEGPAASPVNGAIYFSDIGNRIMRFDPTTNKVHLFREPSGRANGLMFDTKGNLYACEGANGGNRRVTVSQPDGKITVLADRYQGKRLNSPNDLFVDARRRVWFTDPRYTGTEAVELDFAGIYCIDEGQLKLATRQLKKPNGILVSPSLDRLYVAESDSDPRGNHQLVAYSITPDGALSDKQVLFDFGPARRGIDGMTLDARGNVHAAAGSGDDSGIYIFSPAGKPLAKIGLPGPPTNCEFGVGDGAHWLYITGALSHESAAAPGSYGLMRIKLKTGR